MFDILSISARRISSRLNVILFVSLLLATATAQAGERSSFDGGWRFQKSDAPGAEMPKFKDAGWRSLDLPHDWAFEGSFDKQYNARSGGLPFHGIGWYRKTFNIPAANKGKCVFVEFDGAMNNATVWLNGVKLGFHPYGYTGFDFDLTPHLKFGGQNVIAYTTDDTVELLLNGKSLGVRKQGVDPVELPVSFNGYKEKTFASPYRVKWDVPYQSGVLKAVASKDGKVIAETEIRTAGKLAKLALSADRSKITADGQDLSFVTVHVEDADGNLCPLADNLVKFKVTGAGNLAAVENGNPISLESFQASDCKAFNVLVLAIIRPTNQAGGIKLVAEADGLQSGSTTLTTVN